LLTVIVGTSSAARAALVVRQNHASANPAQPANLQSKILSIF